MRNAKPDYTLGLVDGCPPEMADTLRKLRCLVSDVYTFEWRGPQLNITGRNVGEMMTQEAQQRKEQEAKHAVNVETLRSLPSGAINNFLNFTRFLNSDEIECCVKHCNIDDQSFDIIARRLNIEWAIKFFERSDKISRHVIETAKMTQL